MPGMAYILFTAGKAPVSGLMDLPEDARRIGREAELDRICRSRRRGRCRRPDQAPWRSRARPTDGRPRHQPLFGLHRPANGNARVVQVAETRPSSSPPSRAHRGASAGTSCLPPTGSRRWLSTASFLAGKKRTPTSARWARISCSPPEGRRSAACSPSLRHMPVPFWLYYFNVGDIDAAAQRVKAGGGQILDGPIEVPGGSWIVQCTDPQGAIFALEGQAQPQTYRIFRARRTRDPSDARGRRWSW